MKNLKFLFASMLIASLLFSCSKDSGNSFSPLTLPVGTSVFVGANNGGNVTCGEVATAAGCTFEETSGKIDYYGGGGGTVDGIITWTTDGTYVNWSSTVPVRIAIIVKGGPNASVYFSGCEGCVQSGSGLSAPINPANQKPYGLSNITFCYTLCEEEPPLDVFAIKDARNFGKCFQELGTLINGYTSERLGWTNGSLGATSTGFAYTFDLVANITDCDDYENEDDFVGTMTVSYDYENAVVNISMKDGYTLDAIQAYIGPDPLPKDAADNFTDDPAEYPIQTDLEDVSNYSFTVAVPPGDLRIYVLVHADVNGL